MVRAPLGLIGQIFAILLLAILIEFGASTFFYERASQLSVRDDEARRLAEHLVIARKLLTEHPPAERPALATDLTTTRYRIAWSREIPAALRVTPSLDRIHRQVIAWEPSLRATSLRLRLVGSARDAVIVGSTKLPDGSWMHFATREPVHDLGFSPERILLALAPAMALILIGGVLVRQTLLPLRRLALATERVGAGESQEVPEGGPREVRRVIHAFNRMQARIHRLLTDRTQALAAVGHDLRTPLARLRLRADAIDDAATRGEMEADIVEMQTMIDSLLAYLAGEANGEPSQSVDLAVICATIADGARDQGHNVDYSGPAHLERRLHPIAIRRALANLVENGLHHGEHVRIELDTRPGGSVLIRIDDDGPGIPEESLAQVLQPFVRLDTARARDTVGFGLGLSIVSRAVEGEGGTLTLSNRSQGGLRADILLPPEQAALQQ